MKKVLAILGQLLLLILFLIVFFGGSLLDPFHLKWFISHPSQLSTRYFVPDGLILMTLLWVIIVAIEASAKRLRSAGLWTTVAYVLALIIGVAMKFGWLQIDI